MGKCAQPNPNYVPLRNDEEHEEFLHRAFELYVKKAGDPRPPRRYWRDPPAPSPTVDEDLIETLYRLGRDLRVLKGAFDEFRSWLVNGPSPRPWFNRHVVRPFRHKQKYQRKPNHAKKKQNQVRDDWRKRKGFARDHQKSKWVRSAPQWAHRVSARARRQWERKQVHNENWDDLASGDFMRLAMELIYYI